MGRVALGMSTCSLMLLSCALGKLPVYVRGLLLCGAVLGSEDSPFYSQREARYKANSRLMPGSPVQSACVSVSHHAERAAHAEPWPCCFKKWFLLVCTCVGILSINQLAN